MDRHWEQNKDATVYIGNLDERITDLLLWELVIQAGRVLRIHLPKDRITQTHNGFGFVEYTSKADADYASRVLDRVRLFGRPIRVNRASLDHKRPIDIGAEIFIGGLDAMVDEKGLADTFGIFGNFACSPKISRDMTTGMSHGYGFISYTSFVASDNAIEHMDKQFIMNKQLNVQYAFKRDGKGERHGDGAERTLEMMAGKNGVPLVSSDGGWNSRNTNTATAVAPGMGLRVGKERKVVQQKRDMPRAQLQPLYQNQQQEQQHQQEFRLQFDKPPPPPTSFQRGYNQQPQLLPTSFQRVSSQHQNQSQQHYQHRQSPMMPPGFGPQQMRHSEFVQQPMGMAPYMQQPQQVPQQVYRQKGQHQYSHPQQQNQHQQQQQMENMAAPRIFLKPHQEALW